MSARALRRGPTLRGVQGSAQDGGCEQEALHGGHVGRVGGCGAWGWKVLLWL